MMNKIKTYLNKYRQSHLHKKVKFVEYWIGSFFNGIGIVVAVETIILLAISVIAGIYYMIEIFIDLLPTFLPVSVATSVVVSGIVVMLRIVLAAYKDATTEYFAKNEYNRKKGE